MGPDRIQKMKMLRIVRILERETDEQHHLSTQDLIERLSELGISCDRRTLSKDIDLLNENGFEIFSQMEGHKKTYYTMDCALELPELKILIDAVQAANFITDRKTEQLIGKIAMLGGQYHAELLKDNVVRFNTHKRSNEEIYYSVDHLEEAIDCGKKASFFYFDRNERGERVYRREKQRYVVEPIALVYNEDNYYLISYNSKHEGYTNYRVDRMERVEVESEAISERAALERTGIPDYAEQVIKMYGGEMRRVTLKFKRSLIGVVYDRFGEDVSMQKADEEHCAVSVKVQISPTFWGWLFQFAGEMTVESPEDVREEYVCRAMRVVQSHSTRDGLEKNHE